MLSGKNLRAGLCDFVGQNGEIADGVAHAVKASGGGDGGQCCFAIEGHVGCSKPSTVYVCTGRVASDASHTRSASKLFSLCHGCPLGYPPRGTLMQVHFLQQLTSLGSRKILKTKDQNPKILKTKELSVGSS